MSIFIPNGFRIKSASVSETFTLLHPARTRIRAAADRLLARRIASKVTCAIDAHATGLKNRVSAPFDGAIADITDKAKQAHAFGSSDVDNDFECSFRLYPVQSRFDSEHTYFTVNTTQGAFLRLVSEDTQIESARYA